MRKYRILTTFFLLLGFSIFISRRIDAEDWPASRDRLARLETLNRVLYLIKENYVDPERVKPQQMFKQVLDNLAATIAEARVLYPSSNSAVLLSDQHRKEFDTDLSTLYALHASVSDALRFLRDHKKSDISDQTLETIAINSVLDTLDPHSVYLTKDLYDETKVGTTGEFGGLGIVIGIRDAKLTIIAPLADTPAFRAGLQAGDTITKIGDESTVNMGLNEAVEKMRGPKGTRVAITVTRKGWTAEKSFTLTRDKINVVSIESELLPEKIGYIKLKAFQKNTARDLGVHLKRLTDRANGRLKGLILDLRNDPGGLLDQAIFVADKFLKDGVIVTTVGNNNTVHEQEKATGQGTEPNYPMAVLVNPGSASASEIVAGALQRRNRAVVIGRKTFGKGTVQSLFELPEKSALKLTVAKYLTPGDISIQSIGISPDLRTAAAIVTKDLIDIFPSRHQLSEASLDRHFDNPGLPDKTFEPAMTLRYLEARSDREIVDDESRAAAERDDHAKQASALMKDFDVGLARELLGHAGGADRRDLISTAKKIARPIEKREAQKIGEALSKWSIDWSDPPKNKPSRCAAPKASAKVAKKEGPAPLRAGDTAYFSVTVENPGGCDLYQTWAASASKNYLFDDREFLFGKIPAGGSVTREVKIEIPKSTPSNLAEIRLAFKEGNSVAPASLKISVPVSMAATPQFAFNYEINDADGAETKGDGDGLPERGETVEFKVYVRNIGKTATAEAAAALKSSEESALPVRRGRSPIPPLRPGEEKTVSFLLEIPASFREKSADLNLGLADLVYRVTLDKKISLGIASHGDLRWKKQHVSPRKNGTAVRAMPSADAPVIATANTSSVFDSAVSYGKFLRVALPRHRHGWIAADEAAPASAGKEKPAPAVSWLSLSPPSIDIDAEKKAFVPADGQFMKIDGEITDRESVKDLFIMVNQKKVFYQSFLPAQTPGKQKFEATVPLEPGVNRVLLVARNGDDIAQRRGFIVQRARPDGKEADEPPADENTGMIDEFFIDPNY